MRSRAAVGGNRERGEPGTSDYRIRDLQRLDGRWTRAAGTELPSLTDLVHIMSHPYLRHEGIPA